MRFLVIGIGNIGEYTIKEITKYKNSQIEIYTRDQSKYKKYIRNKNIKCLSKIKEAVQPDVIFITANSYLPSERFKQVNKNKVINLDIRDHEKVKNDRMIKNIAKELKIFKDTITITTANPPELITKRLYETLGWKRIYNIQIMLDYLRVLKEIKSDNFYCVGEHGRPTLLCLPENTTIDFVNFHKKVFTKIIKYKGKPDLTQVKKILSDIIKSINNKTQINICLTSYDNKIKAGFGSQFKIKGLDFIKQKLPKLSKDDLKSLKIDMERVHNKWK